MIEELRREQMNKIIKRKKAKRKKFFLSLGIIFCAFIGVLVWAIYDSKKLEVTYYELTSEKVNDTIRFAVLSDLHSREFGEKNQDLIKKISEESPDLIFMVGDMVNKDDENINVIQNLCDELLKIAPIYYSIGNHEGNMLYAREYPIPLVEILQEKGVSVLLNDYIKINIRDNSLCIAGIATSEEDYDLYSAEQIKGFWDCEEYKILLSHYPTLYYEKLKNAEMDLAIAGHFHGGIIRIPGLGGLYHPEDGIFPKYSGGQYELLNGTLIVSRGMGGDNIIPRINNKAELIIIEVGAKGGE